MKAAYKTLSQKIQHPKNYVRLILIAGIFILPLTVKNPFLQDVMIMMFFHAALAGAWNILGGFAGQISLGHCAFFGIGAYTSTLLYLNFGMSPWIGMFIGAGLSVSVGIFIGIPCFRLKSHFFALVTIAIASVLHILSIYFRGLTQGSVGLLIPFKEGLSYLMFREKVYYTYTALLLLAAVFITSYIIKRSKIGYYLMALRDNQDAAEALGVNTLKYKLIAMSISVFYTAIAGTFLAQYLLFIDPETVFSFSVSVDMALFSIIGGLGTVAGPILGAFLLTPVDVFLRGWLGPQYAGLNLLIYGIVLVLAVIYLPHGIIEWFSKLLDYFSDKLSKEHEGQYSKIDEEKISLSPEIKTAPHILSEQPKVFQVEGLNRCFGGLSAVNDISFHIRQNEILSILGPNGAGKTTIFNLISGFLKPDSGRFSLFGKDIVSLKRPHQFCSLRLGRTFQVVKPFESMTVLENVMVGAFSRYKNRKKAEQKALSVISFVGLGKYRDYNAGNLTIADRKRLELARSLATEPKLLLLDEVMAGLTPTETDKIISLVREISKQNITILIIEHVMRAVMSLSDRIVVINYGQKIAEGIPREITKDQKVIEAYLGEEYAAQNR